MILTDEKEKVDQIRIYSGVKYETVDEASPQDVQLRVKFR
jgi:hypothetical protein